MKKALSVLLAAVMVLGLAAVMPITAHAATGPVTIDVSIFTSSNVNNHANAATESQWRCYDRVLTFETDGGNYTLTGTNADLQISPSIYQNLNVTLNNVNVTSPSSRMSYVGTPGHTITLVGNNTLTGGGYDCVWFTTGSINNTITSASGGTLTLRSTASGARALVISGEDNVLRITGNASVTAIGGPGAKGVSNLFNNIPYNNLFIGDNAKLTVTNNSDEPELVRVAKADAATTHQWKLTNATLPTGSVTEAVITVTIAPGQTAVIQREVIPPPTAPTVTSANSLTLTWGTAGSVALVASGTQPITWSLTGSVPAGVTLSGNMLNAANNIAPGVYSFNVNAQNSVSSVSQPFTLTVNGVAPTITSRSSETVTKVGTDLGFYLTATGTTPITWSLSGEPAGVTLSSTGLMSISYRDVPVGVHTFTITASNGTLPNAVQTFRLTVNGVAPAITSANSLTCTAGTGGTLALTATGTTPITWSLGGTVPAGVSVTGSTLSVADTVAAGTYNFTVNAANGTSPNASQAFTLTVNHIAADYIKLWGKTTKWLSNFGNWLLVIFCFGWIWMAF